MWISHLERKKMRKSLMTFLLLFNSLKFSKTSLFCCNGYSHAIFTIIRNVQLTKELWNSETAKLWNYGTLDLSQPFPYWFPHIMWAVLSPFPSKREGDATVPSFALWLNVWIRQYPYNSHIFRVMIYTRQ